MNTYINDVVLDDDGKVLAYEYDANLTTPVIKMLYRNNTFVPGIDRVIFNGKFTKVYFKDGTNVSVKCSENDVYSKDSAIAFAFFKRCYGKLNENGSVDGDGFSSYLHKVVNEMSFDQAAHEKNVKAKAKAKCAAAKTTVKKTTVKCKKSALRRDAKGRFVRKAK